MKLAILAALLLPWSMAAHPLGQESVDRFARLEVTPSKIIVVYDLNMAERSTARELPFLDRNHDGIYDDAEQQAYAVELARRTAADLMLGVDNVPSMLSPISPKIYLTPGEGGLPTLRLITTIEAFFSNLAELRPKDGSHLASFYDKNSPGQVGWRQISVDGLGTSISEQTINGNPATNSAQGYLTDSKGEQTDARWTSFRFAQPIQNIPLVSPAPTNVSPAPMSRAAGELPGIWVLAAIALGSLLLGFLAKRRAK